VVQRWLSCLAPAEQQALALRAGAQRAAAYLESLAHVSGGDLRARSHLLSDPFQRLPQRDDMTPFNLPRDDGSGGAQAGGEHLAASRGGGDLALAPYRQSWRRELTAEQVAAVTAGVGLGAGATGGASFLPQRQAVLVLAGPGSVGLRV
jgi:hypothetical protein